MAKPVSPFLQQARGQLTGEEGYISDFLKPEPATPEEEETDLASAFAVANPLVKGIRSGTQGMIGGTKSYIAALNEARGKQGAAKEWYDSAAQNYQNAALSAPPAESYSEIKNPLDAAGQVLHSVGAGLPTFLPAVVGGGIPRLLGAGRTAQFLTPLAAMHPMMAGGAIERMNADPATANMDPGKKFGWANVEAIPQAAAMVAPAHWAASRVGKVVESPWAKLKNTAVEVPKQAAAFGAGVAAAGQIGRESQRLLNPEYQRGEDGHHLVNEFLEGTFGGLPFAVPGALHSNFMAPYVDPATGLVKAGGRAGVKLAGKAVDKLKDVSVGKVVDTAKGVVSADNFNTLAAKAGEGVEKVETGIKEILAKKFKEPDLDVDSLADDPWKGTTAEEYSTYTQDPKRANFARNLASRIINGEIKELDTLPEFERNQFLKTANDFLTGESQGDVNSYPMAQAARKLRIIRTIGGAGDKLNKFLDLLTVYGTERAEEAYNRADELWGIAKDARTVAGVERMEEPKFSEQEPARQPPDNLDMQLAEKMAAYYNDNVQNKAFAKLGYISYAQAIRKMVASNFFVDEANSEPRFVNYLVQKMREGGLDEPTEALKTVFAELHNSSDGPLNEGVISKVLEAAQVAEDSFRRPEAVVRDNLIVDLPREQHLKLAELIMGENPPTYRQLSEVFGRNTDKVIDALGQQRSRLGKDKDNSFDEQPIYSDFKARGARADSDEGVAQADELGATLDYETLSGLTTASAVNEDPRGVSYAGLRGKPIHATEGNDPYGHIAEAVRRVNEESPDAKVEVISLKQYLSEMADAHGLDKIQKDLEKLASQLPAGEDSGDGFSMLRVTKAKRDPLGVDPKTLDAVDPQSPNNVWGKKIGKENEFAGPESKTIWLQKENGVSFPVDVNTIVRRARFGEESEGQVGAGTFLSKQRARFLSGVAALLQSGRIKAIGLGTAGKGSEGVNWVYKHEADGKAQNTSLVRGAEGEGATILHQISERPGVSKGLEKALDSLVIHDYEGKKITLGQMREGASLKLHNEQHVEALARRDDLITHPEALAQLYNSNKFKLPDTLLTDNNKLKTQRLTPSEIKSFTAAMVGDAISKDKGRSNLTNWLNGFYPNNGAKLPDAARRQRFLEAVEKNTKDVHAGRFSMVLSKDKDGKVFTHLGDYIRNTKAVRASLDNILNSLSRRDRDSFLEALSEDRSPSSKTQGDLFKLSNAEKEAQLPGNTNLKASSPPLTLKSYAALKKWYKEYASRADVQERHQKDGHLQNLNSQLIKFIKEQKADPDGIIPRSWRGKDSTVEDDYTSSPDIASRRGEQRAKYDEEGNEIPIPADKREQPRLFDVDGSLLNRRTPLRNINNEEALALSNEFIKATGGTYRKAIETVLKQRGTDGLLKTFASLAKGENKALSVNQLRMIVNTLRAIAEEPNVAADRVPLRDLAKEAYKKLQDKKPESWVEVAKSGREIPTSLKGDDTQPIKNPSSKKNYRGVVDEIIDNLDTKPVTDKNHVWFGKSPLLETFKGFTKDERAEAIKYLTKLGTKEGGVALQFLRKHRNAEYLAPESSEPRVDPLIVVGEVAGIEKALEKGVPHAVSVIKNLAAKGGAYTRRIEQVLTSLAAHGDIRAKGAFEVFYDKKFEVKTKPVVTKPVVTKPVVTKPVLGQPRILPMNYKDGDVRAGVKHVMRPEFAGKSTLDLIISGDRTATTRFSKPNVKVGETLIAEDSAGNRVEIVVTREPRQLFNSRPDVPIYAKLSNTWSKLEGWAPELYSKYAKAGAWQFEFKLKTKPAETKPETTSSKTDISVNEHSSQAYTGRTKLNVESSDATLVFAADLTTAGEKLTKKLIDAAKKLSGNVPILKKSAQEVIDTSGANLIKSLKSNDVKIINVAGNGAHTLSKHGWGQDRINKYVYELIKYIHENHPIEKIISGGQTGADLAGAVAGHALGIPVEMTLPKGFKQRGVDGKDFKNTPEGIKKQVVEGAEQLAGGVKYSENVRKGDSATVESVQGLRDHFDDATNFDKLIKVYGTEAEAWRTQPEAMKLVRGKAQGFVGKDGKVHLIAENIAKGSELSVLLHEVGVHKGMETLLGKNNMNALARRVEVLSKSGTKLEREAASAALERAKKSSSPSEAETVAYMVEELVNRGMLPNKPEAPSWLRRAWGLIKAALAKLGIVKLDNVTGQDLVNLAYGAARIKLAGTYTGVKGAIRDLSDANPLQFSVNDIIKLKSEHGMSLAYFAKAFEKSIGAKDRTLADADRIGKDIVDAIANKPGAADDMFEKTTAETVKAEYARKLVMEDGTPYDETKLEHMGARPEQIQYSRLLGDNMLEQLALREAEHRNKTREEDLVKLAKYLASTADYSPAEAATLLSIVSRYGVRSESKLGGKIRAVEIKGDNETMVPVVDMRMAKAVFAKLRSGMSAKTALVEGYSEVIAEYVSENLNNSKDGLVKFARSSKLEDAQKLNKECAGTPWCTGTATSTASDYLKMGDFYVYKDNGKAILAFTLDSTGNLTEPPRGINPDQSIPEHHAVIAERLLRNNEVPGGAAYLRDRDFINLFPTGEYKKLGMKDLFELLNKKREVPNGYDDSSRDFPKAIYAALKAEFKKKGGVVLEGNELDKFIKAGSDEQSPSYEITKDNFNPDTPVYIYLERPSPNQEIYIPDIHLNLKSNITIKRMNEGVLNSVNDLPAIEYPDGTKEWYRNGKLHRDNDLPAIEYADGAKGWYQHGLLHRDNDLPALIQADGTKEWHQYGKLHRDNDLPAIEYSYGTKMWYQHALLHRDNNLPAIIQADGTKMWYQNGKLNRDNDLPAIEHADGTKEWYQNGKLHRDNDLPAVIQAKGTKKWYKNGKLHRENDLPAAEHAGGVKEWYKEGKLHRDNDLPAIIKADGTKEWYKKGERHRDNDLPAIEHANGIKEWYQNGNRHRDNDLPAIEHVDGTKEWFKRGLLHRDNDLPAIEYADGTKEWYQYGALHRDNDLPAIIKADGTKEWYKKGKLHRDNDLPAIEHANGTKEWYKNNYLHRDNDLPAIEHADGTKEWWLNGVRHRANHLPAVIRADGTKEWWVGGNRYRENELPTIEYSDESADYDIPFSEQSPRKESSLKEGDPQFTKILQDISRHHGSTIAVKVVSELKKGRRPVSGSFTWSNKEDVLPLIKIAANAKDPYQTGMHESMHAFVRKLGEYLKTSGAKDVEARRTLKILNNLADSAPVIHQLKRLLSEDPRALKQLEDREERLAYAFQFYIASKDLKTPLIKLGPETQSFFAKAWNILRSVVGLLTNDQKAQALFKAFDRGLMQTPDAVGKVLAKNIEFRENVIRKMGKLTRPVTKLASELFQHNYVRLLQTQNPYLKTYVNDMHHAVGEGTRKYGRGSVMEEQRQQYNTWLHAFSNVWEKHGSSEADVRAMAPYLLTGTLPKAMGSPLYAPIKEIYALMLKFHNEYLSKADLQRYNPPVKDTPGHWSKIGKIHGNYFPRVYDVAEVAKNPAEFAKDLASDPKHFDALKSMVDEANRGMSKEAEPVTIEGIANSISQRIIRNLGVGGDIRESASDVGFTPYMAAINKRSLNFISEEFMRKWGSKDIAHTISTYLHQAVKRAEYSRVMGGNNSKFDAIWSNSVEFEFNRIGEKETSKKDLWGELKAIKDTDALTTEEDLSGKFVPQLKHLRKLGIKEATAKIILKDWEKTIKAQARQIMAMEGTLGYEISPKLRRLQTNIIAYENLRTMATAIFAQAIDPLGLVVNGAPLKEAFSAYKEGLKGVWNSWNNIEPKTRDAEIAKMTGILEAASTFAAFGQVHTSLLMSGTGRKINDTFFRIIGLEGFNRGMQIAATRSAINFIKFHSTNKSKYGNARLEELGLKPEDVVIDEQGDLEYSKPKIRRAINRWVSGALVRPNSANRATWSSDAHFQLFAHMKGFSYAFHDTVIKRVIHDAKNFDRWGPAAVLGVLMPGAMIASDAVKALLLTGDGPKWGHDLPSVLEHGAMRAGVLGRYQPYADSLNYGDSLTSLAGPTAEHLMGVINEPWYGNLPGGSVLKQVEGSTISYKSAQ